MADETNGAAAGNQTGEGKGEATPPAADAAKPKGKKAEKAEALAGELKSCDLRPTAEEMFGRFMVSVAGRPLSVHQPVNEIADTAERLTAAWLERKDKFAAK